MSDEEWAFFDRFIRAIRALKDRNPSIHSLVSNGLFRNIPASGPML